MVITPRVRCARTEERPAAYDVIRQARRVVFGYIAQHAPAVVAIERPTGSRRRGPRCSPRSPRNYESEQRAWARGRRAITGGSAPRHHRQQAGDEVRGGSEAGERFPELAALVPKKPHRRRCWSAQVPGAVLAAHVRRAGVWQPSQNKLLSQTGTLEATCSSCILGRRDHRSPTYLRCSPPSCSFDGDGVTPASNWV